MTVRAPTNKDVPMERTVTSLLAVCLGMFAVGCNEGDTWEVGAGSGPNKAWVKRSIGPGAQPGPTQTPKETVYVPVGTPEAEDIARYDKLKKESTFLQYRLRREGVIK